jgi:D-amino-acid dehydrogenase
MRNGYENYSAFNSQKFAEYLIRIAVEEGAGIRYQAEVEGFRIEDKRVVGVKIKGGDEVVGDKIIICCGAQSRKIGRILGWTPPIWPVKGYSLNVESDGKLRYSIAFMLDKPMNIGSMGNYYRVSSFIEFSTIRDCDVNTEKCQFLLEQAQVALGLKDCEATGFWAFQRAVTADDLPIIGKFPRLDNVFINAGHGARSSSLCLGSAELISHIALGQKPLISSSPYSPNRFWI